MQLFCCFRWTLNLWKKMPLYCLYFVAFMALLGFLGPNLMLIVILAYIFSRIYARWSSYKRSLLPVRVASGNDLCLPIDIWQRILSFSYDKETIERSMFDDPRYRLRINCYNDRLQIDTLRSFSCLNLDYYHSTKLLWASIEYLPHSMVMVKDSTLCRLRNVRFLTLTDEYINSKENYHTRLTQLSGLNLPYYHYYKDKKNPYLRHFTSRIEELSISSNYELTDKSIQRIQQLKRLDVNQDCKINDTLLSFFTQLTHLKMGKNSEIEKGWCFQSLVNLESLGLGHVYGEFDYNNLLCLTKLRELDLFDYCMIPGDILWQFPQLTSLALKDNTRITDADIIPLASLTSLSLYNCKEVNGSCFRHLYSLTRLELVCTKKTDYELSNHFRYATNLKILSIKDITPKSESVIYRAYDYLNGPLGRLCDPGNYTNLRDLTYLNLPKQRVVSKFNIHELTQLSNLRFFNNKLLPIKQKRKWF